MRVIASVSSLSSSVVGSIVSVMMDFIIRVVSSIFIVTESNISVTGVHLNHTQSLLHELAPRL